MAKLFQSAPNTFFWKDIKTFLVRNQYNELLNMVVKEYFGKQYTGSPKPRFIDPNYALTLQNFADDCNCNDTSEAVNNPQESVVSKEQADFDNAQKAQRTSEFILEKAIYDVTNQIQEYDTNDPALIAEIGKLQSDFTTERPAIPAIPAAAGRPAVPAVAAILPAGNEAINIADYPIIQALAANDLLLNSINNYNAAFIDSTAKKAVLDTTKITLDKATGLTTFKLKSINKILQAAKDAYKIDPSTANREAVQDAEKQLNALGKGTSIAKMAYKNCKDIEYNGFCTPPFYYNRKKALTKIPDGMVFDLTDLDFSTQGLTVGAVMWLYYYERMGIFKILGVLMDDYNYRGKYTISGSRNNAYSSLMDMICTLHRLGMSSNLRDRICTYQRVLGVTIDNNLGIDSEKNKGFMNTFNKLLDYMLEYYKSKQLAQAIQSQNAIGVLQPRSSVATQTSILDTVNLLKQQFEPLEYGRNQINTFIGIATVHATICLINMLKAEIGIPAQYEKPEEFIPAAYDILVDKRPVTLSEINRYIVYDNCATYGYRLLTDIETVNINELSTIASGATLDIWLNDVEGWVEGYRSAYSSLPERVEAIV
jgi:hypothetical protein